MLLLYKEKYTQLPRSRLDFYSFTAHFFWKMKSNYGKENVREPK